MCLYLTKRGATYYFRRAIPGELQSAFDGRTEFVFSLRTKDRDVAKRKRSVEAIKTDALIEDARAGLSPTKEVPAHNPWEGMSQEDFEQWKAHSVDQTGIASAEDDRMEEAVEWAARIPQSHHAALLLREARQERDGYRERYYSRKARELRAVVLPVETTVRPQSGTMLTAEEGSADIVHLWATERKPAQKTIAMHKSDARWFYDRIGHKPVNQITRQDVLTFKNKLLGEGQTTTNTNNKLSRLRTLLKFAADNGHAEANVAAGISVKDIDAGKRKRLPFDVPSLNAIFASPVYSNGDRPAQGRGEAAYWLPLLALFTGARLEELGQLRPSDVERLAYADADGTDRAGWFIRITAQAGSLKNLASERLVPVHAQLEALGFIAFSQSMQSQGKSRLFHELTPGPHGNVTHKWGQWFGSYLRQVCKVADPRMVFHSFRHTFTDYARRPDIPEGVQRRLVGHGSLDVHDDYGGGYSMHWLVEGMKLYRVPGLILAAKR